MMKKISNGHGHKVKEAKLLRARRRAQKKMQAEARRPRVIVLPLKEDDKLSKKEMIEKALMGVMLKAVDSE